VVPTVGEAPSIGTVEVSAPSLPGGFIPKTINPPEAPEDIVVTPPGEVQANLTGSGANPSPFYYWWNGNGGAISQVSLTSGTFNIKPGNIINVNGYAASNYPGTTPNGTPPSNGDQTVSQTFFHTLLNVPYSEYGSGVVINNNRPGSTLINLETEGVVTGDLGNRESDGYITSTKKAILKGYQTYSNIKGQDNTELLFINKGTVNLNADNTTYLFTTSHTNGEYRTNYLDNEGTIAAKGKNSIIIKHSPDTSQAKAWIYSNNGTMTAEGKGSIVYGAAYFNLPYGRAAFINDGNITVSGEEAIGVIFPKDSGNSALANGYLVWLKKPILLTGKKSMGFVAQNTNISYDKNLVKFNINADSAIGILQDVQGGGTAKTAAKIVIDGKNASESMGIYAKTGTLELIAPHANSGETKSSIELKSGNKNIGIYAKGTSTVNFDGDIKITGGEGQKIALASEGSTINLKNDVTAGDKATNNFVKDAVPLYATGSNSVINVVTPSALKFYLKDNSTAVYAKDKGKINMNRTALPSATDGPDIYLKGSNNKGVALFAKDGGIINARYHHIKVENGSVGISSIGTNGPDKSKIDFQNGKLEYDGNGYAVYSDGIGTVDLTGSELVLGGKSTAFDLDFFSKNQTITLDKNTRIKVDSNDVVVFNLKNATGLSSTGLKTSIESVISTKLAGGATLTNLVNGINGHNNYKIAAADGGTIAIGNLDRSGTDTSTAQDAKDGYYYFNRFLGQRMQATTDPNSTIKSVLTTADAAARYNGQVVGFEMNSSKNAVANTETQINLHNNSKIIADRDGTGSGAIGAFINYGQVDIDGTSSIEVETQTGNAANDKAVGVYSVNGSEVKNAGTITVGGNKSIGILGMPYREVYDTKLSKNVPVVDEFGKLATGQGKVNIINNKDINMTGKDAVGIYVANNNASSTVADQVVTNTGTITVGDSDSATAVGIYADKATVKPENGTIKIGKKAVGIYGTNGAEIGQTGKDLGTVTYTDADGVAIYLKGDSSSTPVIDDAVLKGKKVVLNETSGATGKNKIGILANLGNDATITTEVDPVTNNLKNVVAYFTENKDLTVLSNFSLGEESVGISGKTSKKLTYGDGTNPYTMNVAKNSTGVFGDNVINLKDKTEIKLNDEKAIGAYAKGSNGVINADGKLTFTKESAVGLYVENGAKIVEGSTSNLDFSGANSKKNIGMYLAGSNWEGNSAVTFTSDHAKGNVYIYAQGSRNGGTDTGSTLTPKALFTVSPTGTASATDRTIGIYLNTEVKGNPGSYASNTVDMSN
ncbi:autotransporter-associated N-terminal domain-containing protein, partial [Fusobacterium animalis]